jgi:hypothetical protein
LALLGLEELDSEEPEEPLDEPEPDPDELLESEEEEEEEEEDSFLELSLLSLCSLFSRERFLVP